MDNNTAIVERIHGHGAWASLQGDGFTVYGTKHGLVSVEATGLTRDDAYRALGYQEF
jgi:hypothetical protein